MLFFYNYFWIFILIFIVCLLLSVALLILIERNILGLTQLRKSPNMVSMYGVAQTIMDGMKLLLIKIFYSPSKVNLFFYYSSPLVSFLVSLMLWFIVCSPLSVITKIYSLVAFLFLGSLGAYSLIWASWGSFSIYSMIGSVRAVAQMISYEVVLSFMFLVYIIKSMNLSFFTYLQYDCSNHMSFLLIMVFFISMSAELNRTPFDLVESESELVSGYNVEYLGSMFTVLFLSEYMNIILAGFLGSVIFHLNTTGAFLIILSFLLTRALLPRFKFMDLIYLCWLFLMPAVIMTLFIYLF